MKKAIEIAKNKKGNRILCIDEDHYDEILEYIQRDEKHKKKFAYISGIILDGHKNTDVYDKEDINKNSKDVTAMKFFKNGGSNDRIYCKEVTLEDKTFVIIASQLYEKKKSQKNNEKTKNIINKVGNTDYEIIRKKI